MLYDKRWERKGIANFVRWLEQQPPDRTYDFIDATNCLFAQWLKSVGDDNYVLRCWHLDALFPGALKIAQGLPRTFGGALKRARSLFKTNSVFRQ